MNLPQFIQSLTYYLIFIVSQFFTVRNIAVMNTFEQKSIPENIGFRIGSLENLYNM